MDASTLLADPEAIRLEKIVPSHSSLTLAGGESRTSASRLPSAPSHFNARPRLLHAQAGGE